MTALLETALALAREGYPVFPCKGDKKPACKTGFKDAQIGERDIVDLFERNALAELIGVPTGAASGFDALDIDAQHGGMEWYGQNQYALPPTRIHHTRSGGLHVLFAHVDGIKNTQRKIAPGVDTRGQGGYIVWWPAAGCPVLRDGPLGAWPGWLRRVLLPPPKKPRRVIQWDAPDTDAAADAKAALVLDQAWTILRNAAPGGRHDALLTAGMLIGGLRGRAGLTAPQAARKMCDVLGVDDADAMRTAADALGFGDKKPLLET